MKKYLLLTTALLSFGSLSYASEEQMEERPTLSSTPHSLSTQESEIQAILQKYAPDNLARGAFNDLKTKDIATVQGRQYSILLTGDLETDQKLIEKFRADLPGSLLTNMMRTLSVHEKHPDLKAMHVLVTYVYSGAYTSKGSEYFFTVKTALEAQDHVKLTALMQESLSTQASASTSSSSSVTPSPRLSPSASSDTLSTESDSEERIQSLLALLEQLQQENTLLKSTASSSTPLLSRAIDDLPVSEVSATAPAAPLAPPPPPPPAPSGSSTPAKTSHIKIPEGLNEDEGNLYKTLNAQQRTRVNKMKPGERKDYLSLSSEERLANDLKAQKLEEVRTQQLQSHSQTLDAIKARGQIGAFSEEESPSPASSSAPSEEKVTPLFEEVCGQATSKEEVAFKKAQGIWRQIPAPRLREVAEGYANNPLIRIMLEVMSGKTPLMTDKRLISSFSPKGVDDTFNSLKRRIKVLKAEDLPSNEEWRQAVIYALLKTRIGPYEKEAQGLIAALR